MSSKPFCKHGDVRHTHPPTQTHNTHTHTEGAVPGWRPQNQGSLRGECRMLQACPVCVLWWDVPAHLYVCMYMWVHSLWDEIRHSCTLVCMRVDIAVMRRSCTFECCVHVSWLSVCCDEKTLRMHAHMYICIYVYIYIHTHTSTHSTYTSKFYLYSISLEIMFM